MFSLINGRVLNSISALNMKKAPKRTPFPENLKPNYSAAVALSTSMVTPGPIVELIAIFCM